jgi:hypothetical protein
MSADIGVGSFVEWVGPPDGGPTLPIFIKHFGYLVCDMSFNYCGNCDKSHNGLHFTNGPKHISGWAMCEFKPIDKPVWWDELTTEITPPDQRINVLTPEKLKVLV